MDVTSKLYREVKEFCNETFGPEREPRAILNKLIEEQEELTREVQKYDGNLKHIPNDMLSEYADVQITLWNLMSNFRICHNRLNDAIAIKLNILKKRKWEKQPDGTYQHIAGADPVTGEVKTFPVDHSEGLSKEAFDKLKNDL